jgi:hypothetical protein
MNKSGAARAPVKSCWIPACFDRRKSITGLGFRGVVVERRDDLDGGGSRKQMFGDYRRLRNCGTNFR